MNMNTPNPLNLINRRHARNRPLVAAAVALAAIGIGCPTVLAQEPTQQPSAREPNSGPETVQMALQHCDPIEVASVINAAFSGAKAVPVTSANAVIVVGHPTVLARVRAQVSELETAAALAAEDRRAALESDPEQQRLEELSITIAFPGGTVSEYLDIVRSKTGSDNVVVVDEEIRTLKMPKVNMRQITGVAAVQILETLRFETASGQARLHVDHVVGDPEGVGIDALPVTVIDFIDGDERRAASAQVLETQVIGLRTYQKYEPNSVKALLEALEVGASLKGRSPSFTLKLHEATGLLFVRGTPQDLDLVHETVAAFMQ